jgi:hypothetical protein
VVGSVVREQMALKSERLMEDSVWKRRLGIGVEGCLFVCPLVKVMVVRL